MDRREFLGAAALSSVWAFALYRISVARSLITGTRVKSLRARGSVALVTGGISQYSIYLGSSSSSTESYAAQELQKYIKQISGATLPIVTTSGNAPYISIGDNEASSQFVVPSRYAGDDTFRIYTDSSTANMFIKGALPRATLFGVYRFLELIGCRWFAPNTVALASFHEYVPHLSDITVGSTDVTEQPLMKYRKKDDAGTDYAQGIWALVLEWMSKNCCNTMSLTRSIYEEHRDEILQEASLRGIRLEVGKHQVTRDFLDPTQYFGSHPEWYGSIDGQRVTSWNGKLVMFETGNTDAVSTFEGNTIAYLKTRPEIDVFELWPLDSCLWSTSPESMSLGPTSERMALLVQSLQKAIKDAGLTTRVSFIAYGPSGTLEPPQNMEFDSDTIVEFCPFTQNFAYYLEDAQSGNNASLNSYLKEWISKFPGEVSHYSYYAKESWDSLPVALAEQIAHEMAYWNQVGEVGASIYTAPGNWLTLEVNHIAFAKASWNPDFFQQGWYSDYLTSRFGAASAFMEDYLTWGTQTSLGALISPSAAGDPSVYSTVVQDIYDAIKSALTFADTPAAVWIINKFKWQPDYVSAALNLQIAISRNKPADQQSQIQDQIKTLVSVHVDDGTFIGKVFKGFRFITDVPAGPDNVPAQFVLNQNYPNPFNPTTVISYSIPENSRVTLRIVDMLGRMVIREDCGTKIVGTHEVSINLSKYASGVYLYRLTAQGDDGREFVSTRKMTLLK